MHLINITYLGRKKIFMIMFIKSQIKFYKHKRYISVNRITTHINLQDETITYILHKTHYD